MSAGGPTRLDLLEELARQLTAGVRASNRTRAARAALESREVRAGARDIWLACLESEAEALAEVCRTELECLRLLRCLGLLSAADTAARLPPADVSEGRTQPPDEWVRALRGTITGGAE